MKKIVLSFIILFIGCNYVFADVKFSKCIDGDTFKLLIDDKEETVRLIAVDTPESVKKDTEVEYYGKEASEYTCNMLKKGKKITIEYDDNSDKVDKYDRLLLWVFIDDKLLQEYLVENGYAKVAYLYNDYKYTDRLFEKQEIASSKNKGIWNMEAKEEYESKKDNIEDKQIENKEIALIVSLFMILIALFKLIKK